MDLPVKFPSEAEVILEDVARFRALPPEGRLDCLRTLINGGALMMRISPKAEWLKAYSEEQERLTQRNIREFISKHGDRR